MSISTKYFLVVAFLCITFNVNVECQQVPKQPSEPINLSPFVRASNEFGLSLINEINPSSSEHPQEAKNVLFSPLALSAALAMVHQGAEGQTAQQLESALKLDPSLEKSQIPQAVLDSMTTAMNSNDDNTILKIANSFLLKDGLQLTESYKKTIQDHFQADIFFSDSPNSLSIINQKISEKTDKHIENALKAVPGEILMLLMSFVYFKGDWMFPFMGERHFQDVFTGHNDVHYQNVTYMSTFGQFGFIPLYEVESDMVELPFKGDNIGLYVILPRDPNDDLSEIRSSLNSSYIETMINRLSYRHESTVTIPRLNLDMEYDQMSDVLKQMGINDAFSATDAKFSSMSSTPLHLNQIIHRSRLVLEETRAAGSSVAEGDQALAAMAKPLLFEFNHPFFYFIRHKQSGQIILLGEIQKF